MESRFKRSLCFDDVLLTPRYSTIESRSEVDISSELEGMDYKFTMPIISSPMDTITEDAMATAMSRSGGLGIVHRYNNPNDQSRIVEKAYALGVDVIGAAVGVSGDFLSRARSLVAAGANVICVDIAHGHHDNVKRALKKLRDDSKVGSVHLMAGNVATVEAFNDLADWGADSIRVGIGGGSICSTRVQTGHGMPTFQSVMDCAKSDRDASLIADGGIRNSGDIVKALAAGADFVMLGSLLAGTDETPGNVIHVGKNKVIRVKSYRGMASVQAQLDWRGRTSSEEGVSTTVKCKGALVDVLRSLDRGIRSGLSYSGARSLSELRSVSQFSLQTSLGSVEGTPHILTRK